MSDLDQATHLLHRVGQCAEKIYAKTVPVDTLTPRQFIIIATIGANAGLSQTELVELTNIDRSTIAEMISRLIDREFVERNRRLGDRRTYELQLTTSGRRAMRTVRPHFERVNRRIEAEIPQCEAVFAALRLMLSRLSGEIAS